MTPEYAPRLDEAHINDCDGADGEEPLQFRGGIVPLTGLIESNRPLREYSSISIDGERSGEPRLRRNRTHRRGRESGVLASLLRLEHTNAAHRFDAPSSHPLGPHQLVPRSLHRVPPRLREVLFRGLKVVSRDDLVGRVEPRRIDVRAVWAHRRAARGKERRRETKAKRTRRGEAGTSMSADQRREPDGSSVDTLRHAHAGRRTLECTVAQENRRRSNRTTRRD